MRSSELRLGLRAEVADRLAVAGWRGDRDEDTSVSLAFSRPLGEDFRVVAVIECAGGADRGPVLIDHLFAGVSYEPLRRLYPLLGAPFCRFLPQGAIEEGLAREAEDGCLFEVREPADVAPVAERLSALIEQRAVPAVERVATLESLLEDLDRIEDPWQGSPVVPAVLAAAGRLDEARALLQRTARSGLREADDEDTRVVRQLRRWIDSGADPALIPATPPPSPYATTASKSLGEMWGQTRARTRAREHAIREVRRHGASRSRDQQRAILRRALAQTGHDESGVWIEQTLDHLWDSPADRASARASTLKEVGRIGIGIARAIRARALPDMSPPDWIKPPPHAAYALPSTDRWLEVHLDPHAHGWLERVHQATPHAFGISVPFPVWLDYDPERPDDLAVHIGAQRVGHLAADDAPAFRASMDAAQFRDELPAVTAHLASRPQAPRFVLEIAAPPDAITAA